MNPEEVKRIAALAKLNPEDSQTQKLAEQFAGIFEYFEQIQSVDTEGVEPLVTPTDLEGALAMDEVSEKGVASEELLELAPEKQGSLYKVPPVV